MDNFIFSINATIPIFLVILLGWFLMKIHIITEEFANVANKYVFKVALPVLLFRDIATTSILDDLNVKFVLFCFFGTIIMFGLVWVFALIYCKDRTMIGAFVQGGARGSAAVLGVAFVENICGNSGMAPLMIVSAVPMYRYYICNSSDIWRKRQTEGNSGYQESVRQYIEESDHHRNIAWSPVLCI